MPFQIPDNIHPNCAPLAWIIGSWRGNGQGDYPTIEGFHFGQADYWYAFSGNPTRTPGGAAGL